MSREIFKKATRLERTREQHQKHNSTSNTMSLNSYLSIINVNVNGLDVPMGIGIRMDERNKNHLYVAYKRLILDLRKHPD